MIKVSTPLQTAFGAGNLHIYPFSEGNYIVFVIGDIRGENSVLTRVHDQCTTADILHSNRCDCRQQRIEAVRRMRKNGRGIFIHTPLEGRGQGLLAKIQQYAIQSELGMDTLSAAQHLGYNDDSRDYDKIPLILADLAVNTICLLTNNPRKIAKLRQFGVAIDMVLPLLAEGLPEEASLYLSTKQQRCGHYAEAVSTSNREE
jgi:GTP cyclohydrolase II